MSGQIVRDFLYVGDLVCAIQRAIESDKHADVFNVGSGNGMSVLHLLQLLQHVIERKAEIRYWPDRVFDVPANVLATEKIQAALDWQPEVSLTAGILRTWAWIRSAI